VVTGAPYYAEQLQEYTEPGKTKVERSNIIARFARDGKGRTWSTWAMKAGPFWKTEIYDPVAGVAMLLDDDAKVAHRMRVQPMTAEPEPPRGETLGLRVVDGIPAEGLRRASGPLSIETWTSPELRLELLLRSSNGYVHRIVNLTRSEPDPAMFGPPAGYRVVDESGSFSVSVRNENRALR
jgi:hypothetical protein